MGLLGSELFIFQGWGPLRQGELQAWVPPMAIIILHPPSMFSILISLPQKSEESIYLVVFNLRELLQYFMSQVGCPLIFFFAFVYLLLKNHYLPERNLPDFFQKSLTSTRPTPLVIVEWRVIFILSVLSKHSLGQTHFFQHREQGMGALKAKVGYQPVYVGARSETLAFLLSMPLFELSF